MPLAETRANRGNENMGASGFEFEMENGKLVWTYPSNAPDVTDDQARTMAIANLAGAIEKLAESVLHLANRGKDG